MTVRTEPIAPSLRRGRGRPDIATLLSSVGPGDGMMAELKPPLTDVEALAEAYRCLECGGPEIAAPCQTACPADVDVAGFVGAIARGQVERATDLILEANPLGGSCARVCPTEILCEGACVLEAARQRPVDIGRLQRYAADRILLAPLHAVTIARPANSFRVAVIGAGPAGLACAAMLAPKGYRVTVYDARPEVGGLARYAIAPYRLWSEPLPQEMRRLEALGVLFELGHALETPEELALLEGETEAIFLAVGLGPDIPASIPGDGLDGVYESLPFIERIKMGRPPHVGARVAVIGGGNTAIDVAREALRLGATEVTLVYRRTEAEMPAYAYEVGEARQEGVRFLWLVEPRCFLGEDRLRALEGQVMRLGEPDASGRRRPEPLVGKTCTVAIDTAVKAMGQSPRLPFLQSISGLAVSHGRIVADLESGRTGNRRYFAGGDALNGGGTVVEAVRMGKVAAAGIHRTLTGGDGL